MESVLGKVDSHSPLLQPTFTTRSGERKFHACSLELINCIIYHVTKNLDVTSLTTILLVSLSSTRKVWTRIAAKGS